MTDNNEALWNKVREEARALAGGRGIGDLLAAVDALAQQAATPTKADEWEVIRRVQVSFAPLVKAAIDLLVAVDERHDNHDAPLKYAIPYGAVNALRDALGARQAATPAPAEPHSLWVARSAIESALNNTPERVHVPYAYTEKQAESDVEVIFRRAALKGNA